MVKEILNFLDLFILICGLFNDAVSRSDYMTSKGKISESWVRKYLEGSSYGMIWVTIMTFVWRKWGKSQKPH